MSHSLLTHDTLLTESPRLVMGAGSVTAVAAEVERVVPESGGPPRVLLVVGGGFPGRPWREHLLGALRHLRVQIATQSRMPTPECVARLAGEARAHRADVIVAVGGGSVMDAAKAAAAMAGVWEQAPDGAIEQGVIEQRVIELCAHGAPDQGLPVIAVPTTPGTGAEATHFSTIWDLAGGRKLSLRGSSVRPATAILDPDLLRSLPPGQLASSLLDSLAQGLEAAWSTRADERAEELGAAAWAELADFLERPAQPLDSAQRRAVLLGGHYAGRAIAIAGTTMCHALSYPITLHHGVSHGHACGLTLGPMLRYNAAVEAADCDDPRGPERVRAAVAGVLRSAGAGEPDELARRLARYLGSADLPAAPDLRPDASRIAAEALSYDRAGSNPRRIGPEVLARLLNDSHGGEHAR